MFTRPLTFISTTVNNFFELKAIKQLEKSHPKLVGFVRNRLGMQDFLGLPLTLLLIILVINLSMLSEIAENIVNSPGMEHLDSSVSLFLFHLRTDALAKVFYYFTQLGSSISVAVAFIITLLILLFKRKKDYIVALLVSVLGSGISIYFTKLYFHRERPLDVAYYTATSFSFPSGHTAGAIALFGIICVFLSLERQHIKWARFWIVLDIAYIILMGFSRLYLGVHFVSDVAAGYLLGSLWLILAVCVLEYLMLRKRKKKTAASTTPIS
ncbi:phosphatase PAP2 family protein [Pontibacter sp. 172403-2]|uniref:phosphatase PAP2 family protein n=1 Tax=Pontibacter rufus TaxID=2791028 RepID=UPI0018AFD39D|nr:phosphatase PAP2 family protein [Pontibacter sp. 172403-2]MBF9252239.1 phosphatase PAP2 family protein [Pontibacter sp. 172403-2]